VGLPNLAGKAHDVTVTSIGGDAAKSSAARSPSGPSESEQDSERARLLNAARAVLERSGWWGFKVESVLREARLSTRSFYRHFDSKTELLLSLLETEMGRLSVHLGELVATIDDNDPDAQLTMWIETTLGLAYNVDLAGPATMYAEHWRELLSKYPARIVGLIDSQVATLTPIIERGKSSGLWPNAAPYEDGLCLFYLVSGLSADVASARAERPRETTVALLTTFARRALAGPA
jgi:AcrR family transcriptional regulator